MLERRTLPLVLALVLAGTAGAATLDRPLPLGYAVPGLDGTPVSIDSTVEQKTVSAWAYRVGREFDLAVAILDATGTWSAPTLLGRADGFDQVQPALAVDGAGNVYLAMTVRPSHEIHLSILPAGSTSWTLPVVVSVAGERAMAPTVRVVGDRLVVAYRSRATVVVRDFALHVPAVGTDGVQDGPDILPPSADGTDDKGDGSNDSSGSGVKPAHD
jgi:hypothetical protein